MDIYEIAHALRDIQDKNFLLAQDINDLRKKVDTLLAQGEKNKARLAEHTAKYGNRPMITLEGK